MTITREELHQWIEDQKDCVLIDTLGEESYRSRHLPGAIMADGHKEDFVEQVGKAVLFKSMPVVVYCASFECKLSSNCAKKLVDAGYEQVYDFKGGLQDWEDGGYSFE